MSPNLQIRRSSWLKPALFCGLVGTIWASAPPALADSRGLSVQDSIRIESSTCPQPLLDDAQRFLRVELKNTSVVGGESAPRIILSCSEQVNLIRAQINGRESSQQLDLGHTEIELHARVIALAVAELLRDAARAEAVEPPLVPHTTPPRRPALTASEQVTNHLVAFAKLENFGSSFQPLFGGGCNFSHDLGHFSVGLGSTLAMGQRRVELGSVRILAADLALRLAYRFPNHTLPGEMGVGHALGLARLTGDSSLPRANAHGVTGPWAGPFVFGVLDVGIAEPLFLEVAAQFGVVTFPVRGLVEHEANVEIAGLWSGVSLGLGLNL